MSGRNSVGADLAGTGMEKINRSGRQLLRVMEEMPLFQSMHDRERAELGEIADIVRCPGGTIIYEDKEEGEYIYFIVQGSVELRTRVGPGMAHSVRSFKDEGIMGLQVALGAPSYHMQCYARDKTAAIRLKRSDLLRLLKAEKPAGIKVFVALGVELGKQLRAATTEAVYMLEATSMMPQKTTLDGASGLEGIV